MSDEKPFVLPEGAEVNSDGSVTYPLRFPIKYKVGAEERSVASVTIRRKNMADNLAIKKVDHPFDIAFTLIQRLCNLEPETVKLMDDVDCSTIADIVEGFTMPGQLSGSGSSAT